MKKNIVLSGLIIVLFIISNCKKNDSNRISNPDPNDTTNINLKNGKVYSLQTGNLSSNLFYSISLENGTVKSQMNHTDFKLIGLKYDKEFYSIKYKLNLGLPPLTELVKIDSTSGLVTTLLKIPFYEPYNSDYIIKDKKLYYIATKEIIASAINFIPDSLICIDITNLNIAWKLKINTKNKNQSSYRYDISTIEYYNNEIIFTYFDSIYSVNATNGQFIWQKKLNDTIISNIVVDNNKIYAALKNNTLISLDVNSGNLFGSISKNFYDGIFQTKLSSSGGALFTGHSNVGNTAMFSLSGNIPAYITGFNSTYFIDYNVIYKEGLVYIVQHDIPSDIKSISCIDVQNYNYLWSSKISNDDNYKTESIIVDSMIVVFTDSLFAFNRFTGNQIWKKSNPYYENNERPEFINLFISYKDSIYSSKYKTVKK
jgi:hypothetical protein